MSRVGNDQDAGRRVSRRVTRGFQGSRLAAARKAFGGKPGMTIPELARLSGVSAATLRRWESDITVPQIDKLLDVAEILEIKVPMESLIEVPRDERYPVDWRALFGLLQPTLGAMIGVRTTVVSDIERGGRLPTPKQATAIAKIYGIAPAEFLASCERARARPPRSSY
ncbi:transcriptional regulator (plasmid) [Rhodococcus sp. H-CA8f]|jgi:transcriptional regulator with XRE-family HTH domain|nr:transcriptional regulator [Rhodococcus sp. H-CA8f]